MLEAVAAKPRKDRETNDVKPKEHHERARATLPYRVGEGAPPRQRRKRAPPQPA
jgi:hypothetical protein